MKKATVFQAIKLAFQNLLKGGRPLLIKICILGILTAVLSLSAARGADDRFVFIALYVVCFLASLLILTPILMRHAVYGTAFTYNPFQGWGYKDTWRAFGIYTLFSVSFHLTGELIIYLFEFLFSPEEASSMTGVNLLGLLALGIPVIVYGFQAYLSIRIIYFHTAMLVGRRFEGVRSAWALTRKTVVAMLVLTLMPCLPLLGMILLSIYLPQPEALMSDVMSVLFILCSILFYVTVIPLISSIGYFYKLREAEKLTQMAETEGVPTVS